ncbi:dihydrodipicolinate synthase family protein [Ochrobactrum quorumnocens]|jgi:4-hydroxy-tetrahydrodipicolinate synthase|uniref:Dihydrodipicolinate synthase family protein n=1 Tax=Ochrobactrum quorumnocens TaxID=271865 RepID=A0A5N1K9S0_9HYPH|nr:dihydrodipicolinate synthase family protein [[Ochrobactrum] quorumnocens]KAA9370984.1 dihydrodipicolinate synthase family protein [[Ochrobactrum] quorumnocens]
MEFFKGLSAFPLTPIDAAGNLMEETLCRFLERIHAAGADSIGLLGSTGGYAFLTREQRQRTVQAAVKCIGGKTPIIVGVGALRTDDAQALARDAENAGADGLLLAPVSYTPLTPEEVFQHFQAVAETTALPLCIYNNPGTTKFVFSDELIVRLAHVKNIKAIKMPLPANDDYAAEIAKLRAATPDDFAIGYSGDWGAKDALLAGADTFYSVAAGLLPVQSLALARASQSGNRQEAERLNAAFEPLWELFKTFGSFRVMYVIADLLGLAKIEPPRPILPLAAEPRGQVEAALNKINALNF